VGDDDLCFGVNGDLGIVGLYEAVLAPHDPELWIGEVFLHLGVRRGGAAGRPPLRRGTKIEAKASKHEAMSYGRREERATDLEAEVASWLSAESGGCAGILSAKGGAETS
jgi:hypothetical protein